MLKAVINKIKEFRNFLDYKRKEENLGEIFNRTSNFDEIRGFLYQNEIKVFNPDENKYKTLDHKNVGKTKKEKAGYYFVVFTFDVKFPDSRINSLEEKVNYFVESEGKEWITYVKQAPSNKEYFNLSSKEFKKRLNSEELNFEGEANAFYNSQAILGLIQNINPKTNFKYKEKNPDKKLNPISKIYDGRKD